MKIAHDRMNSMTGGGTLPLAILIDLLHHDGMASRETFVTTAAGLHLK